MNYKTIFNLIAGTFALSQFVSSFMHAGFGGQWPSQEEIAQTQEIYRQELERFEAMSPEEQTQYLDDIIESMSPEERQQLEELEQYFASDEFQELYEEFASEFEMPGSPQTPSAPMPAVQPPAPAKTEKELEAEKSQQEAASALAQAAERIARNIEALQVIASSIPDFKTDVDEWAEDKDIQPWQAGMTWELFNSTLHNIIQNLLKTARYDNARKQYPYMKHALEKQGLRKIIEQLDQSLDTLIIQARGLKTGSKQQEQLLKQILSTLSQSIIGQKLPEQLNELISMFTPEAEELRKQLSEQEQKALQHTRTPARSRPVMKAGRPVTETPHVSRPAPPSGKQRVRRTPKIPPKKRDRLTLDRKQSPGGGSGASQGGKQDSTTGKKGDKGKGKKSAPKDSGKKGEDGKDKKDKDKKKDEKKDKVADEFLQKLESALVRMSATLASLDIASALANPTINAADLGNLAGQTKGIQASMQELRRAITQFSQRLQALSPEAKKSYTNKAKKQLSISKKEIDRFARAINTQNPNTLASVKTRYLFFTAPGTDEATFAEQLPPDQRQQYNTWIAADAPDNGAPLGPERARLSQQRIELKPIGQVLQKISKELEKIR